MKTNKKKSTPTMNGEKNGNKKENRLYSGSEATRNQKNNRKKTVNSRKEKVAANLAD